MEFWPFKSNEILTSYINISLNIQFTVVFFKEKKL